MAWYLVPMILVINAHPSRNSFTGAIADSYAAGAQGAGAQVEVINLVDLVFDPILHDGYGKIMPLEPDLVRVQELIKSCKKLVICYPQWWGSGPALLKGFIDRTFLPGFAFKYRGKSGLWDKLLVGRSAELWLMSDSPRFWFVLMYWNSPIKWLKTATLGFCGFKPIKVQVVDRVRFLTEDQREKALQRAHRAGAAAAN
jgi:NAD(P)H dehydrogenase (quinone)